MKFFGLILLVAIKSTASECLPGTYQTEYSDCEGEYDYSESYEYSEVSELNSFDFNSCLYSYFIHILFDAHNFSIFSKLPTGRPYPIPITKTTTTTTTTTSTIKTPLTLTTTLTSSTAQTVTIETTKKV